MKRLSRTTRRKIARFLGLVGVSLVDGRLTPAEISMLVGSAAQVYEALRAERDGTAPDDEAIRQLRRQIRAEIARDAGHLLRAGAPDRAAATSKTFRSLARICGAAPSGDGPLTARALRREDLARWIPKLIPMTAEELADLPGVSPSRTHQILPGALVAEAAMDIFDLEELEICPWALREGVILERLDQIPVLG